MPSESVHFPDDIALLLSPAVVYGEVNPKSFEIYENLVWGSVSVEHFFNVLDGAIEKLSSTFERIAISYSGGVDSAYCLYKLTSIKRPENILPIYFDAPADIGEDYSKIVLRTLEAIDNIPI